MARLARPRPRTGIGLNRDEAIAILSSPEASSSRGSSPPRSSQQDTKPTVSVLGKRSVSRQISNDHPYSPTKKTNSRRIVGYHPERQTEMEVISTSASASEEPYADAYNSQSRYGTMDESDDDDDFFNRRVARGGSRLSPYNEVPHAIHVDSGSSTAEEDGWSSEGESRGKKKRRGLRPSKWLEQWSEAEEDEEEEKQVKLDPDQRLNSGDETERDELAEGSASDGDHVGNHASRGANRANSGKRRKRSVSLTPPPPLSKEAERQVQELLDRNMGPTHLDDSDDEDAGNDNPEDPSPKAVRRRALNKQHRSRSATNDAASTMGAAPNSNGRGRASADARSPVGDIHPDLAFYYRGSEAADIRKRAEEERRKEDQIRAARQKELQARLKRNEEARRAKQQARDHDDEDGAVMVISDSDGDVTSTNSKVPPPLKQQSQQSKATATQTGDVIDIGDSSSEDDRLLNGIPTQAQSPQPPAAPVPVADEPRIAVSLRAANGKSIEMKVKSTTLFRTMLDHFMGQLTDQEVPKAKRQKARLTFDGETIDLDSTTADLDLEGDEMIDVQW